MKARSIARVSLLAELDNGQILERLKVVNSRQKRDLQLELWLRPGQMGALSLLQRSWTHAYGLANRCV
jgi:hypothetical protein